ncbi:hypothetical protein BMS3Abin02_00767 [bacterium BMS3Abin02]|nr:hypothetical protein BMS3Abin02_00767 [bacterium BMS3Abin02]GBE23086.1 hypothetical protein BMS3Bbin01_02468 [bacterium BMS3Bbin01]HDH26683.1 hypothetical protein [Actinomycetota bacterium]HDL49259.1 hypothetical protein [Actinomycetota bacterium]
MSSHDVTVAIYALIALVGVAVQLMSLREGSDIPSLGQVLTRIMHSRSGRIGVMAGWMWLGLHYFAR